MDLNQQGVRRPLETQGVHNNRGFTQSNGFQIRVVHSTVQDLFHLYYIYIYIIYIFLFFFYFKNKRGNTINIYINMHTPVNITMIETEYAFQVSYLIVPNITCELKVVVKK